MRIFHDQSAMDAELANINSAPNETDRINNLVDIVYSPPIGDMREIDPFSAEYKRRVLDIYFAITGRISYEPVENEVAPYLEEIKEDPAGGIYLSGSTRFVGDLFVATGEVLRALDASPGVKILEYGAGEGVIALEAAKCGCDVTIVDIETRYLEIVRKRAAMFGKTVKTMQGEFGHDCEGTKFDRILFYEAFHHALDHAAVVRQLHKMLNPGGYVILAGEPIIGPHNEHWRPILSYPWGLRLDGLSYRAIQTYGWLELGFDMGYLVEMFMRAAFCVEYRESTAAGERGSVYIARPFEEVLRVGERFIIAANGRFGDWHEPEGEHRWTAREEAVLPVPSPRRAARLSFANYCADARPFEIESGGFKESGMLAPGEIRTVALMADGRITIRTELFSPGPNDPRMLGLAVQRVEFL